MIDRYNCYGWDIRRGEMRCEDDGEYVRHSDYADLERQIAELRAELSEARRQACDNGMELCRERSRAQAAEAENERLKALPLRDEVERVLEQAKERLQFGFASDRAVNAAVIAKIDAVLSAKEGR